LFSFLRFSDCLLFVRFGTEIKDKERCATSWRKLDQTCLNSTIHANTNGPVSNTRRMKLTCQVDFHSTLVHWCLFVVWYAYAHHVVSPNMPSSHRLETRHCTMLLRRGMLKWRTHCWRLVQTSPQQTVWVVRASVNRDWWLRDSTPT
jgi:hypothetical protein